MIEHERDKDMSDNRMENAGQDLRIVYFPGEHEVRICRVSYDLLFDPERGEDGKSDNPDYPKTQITSITEQSPQDLFHVEHYGDMDDLGDAVEELHDNLTKWVKRAFLKPVIVANVSLSEAEVEIE